MTTTSFSSRNGKMLFFVFLILCSLSGMGQSAFDKMTNEKMQKVLFREADKVKGSLGNWQVSYREMELLIITDENFNRMRVIAPVVEESELEKEDFKILLEANFDKALDAKYSLYKGVLWSSFTHPLGELTVEQFKDAMDQVAALAKSYGTTYTSTNFVFGASTGDNSSGDID